VAYITRSMGQIRVNIKGAFTMTHVPIIGLQFIMCNALQKVKSIIMFIV
jgi:hypothetical protein